MKHSLIFFIVFYFILPAIGQPMVSNEVRIKNLEEKLQKLEQQQKEFNQWYSDFYVLSKERVSPFLGEKISLGGFFETGVTYLSGEATPSQLSANSNVLGINLAAEFSEKIRFVTQYLTVLSYNLPNPNNNIALPERQFTTPVFGALVAHAYIEYRKSEAFAIQSGLGYAPFGHAFQQREPVLFRRRNGPQMLGSADANSVGVAFPLWMGLHALGSTSLGKNRVGYNLYTFSPTTNTKALGGGARFWWSDSQNTTLGVSTQYADEDHHSYYSYGADINIKFKNFGLVAEYARNKGSMSGVGLISYYIEPYYEFNEGEWLIYLVGDYLDHSTHVLTTLTGNTADPFEKWQYGGGVNWLPLPNARFRLGVLSHDYIGNTDMLGGRQRDFVSVDFSTSIAF